MNLFIYHYQWKHVPYTKLTSEDKTFLSIILHIIFCTKIVPGHYAKKYKMVLKFTF